MGLRQYHHAMPNALPNRVPNAAEVAALGAQQTAELLQGYAQTVDTLKHQIEWFKRQLFGSKSERFAPLPQAQQMHLGQVLGQELPVLPEQHDGQAQVPAHTRRRPRGDFTDDSASAPFFDESKVPVETIEVPNPEAQALAPDQY
jgi:transposase